MYGRARVDYLARKIGTNAQRLNIPREERDILYPILHQRKFNIPIFVILDNNI